MATRDERAELRQLAKDVAAQAMAVTDRTTRLRLLVLADRVQKMGAEPSE